MHTYISTYLTRTHLTYTYRYNAGYPEVMPGIDLSSSCGIPFALLRKKEKECLEAAKTKQKDGLSLGLFSAIYEHIFQFIENNRFVPCWKELKQLVSACEGDESTTVVVDEKRGAIKLQMSLGKYKQTFQFVVPEEYPEQGVEVSMCVFVYHIILVHNVFSTNVFGTIYIYIYIYICYIPCKGME